MEVINIIGYINKHYHFPAKVDIIDNKGMSIRSLDRFITDIGNDFDIVKPNLVIIYFHSKLSKIGKILLESESSYDEEIGWCSSCLWRGYLKDLNSEAIHSCHKAPCSIDKDDVDYLSANIPMSSLFSVSRIRSELKTVGNNILKININRFESI